MLKQGLVHAGETLNPYKQAWALHANQIRPQHRELYSKPKSSSPTITDRVVSEIQEDIAARLAFVGLSYMATSHYGKLRIVGSVGLRLLPVIGIAAVAYSIYKYLD